MPAYTLVNGRVSLSNIAGTGVTRSLWVKDLFDVEDLAGGTALANTVLDYTAGFLGAPRPYGVELRFGF